MPITKKTTKTRALNIAKPNQGKTKPKPRAKKGERNAIRKDKQIALSKGKPLPTLQFRFQQFGDLLRKETSQQKFSCPQGQLDSTKKKLLSG